MTLREVLETKVTGLIPKFRAWFDSEMYNRPVPRIVGGQTND